MSATRWAVDWLSESIGIVVTPQYEICSDDDSEVHDSRRLPLFEKDLTGPQQALGGNRSLLVFEALRNESTRLEILLVGVVREHDPVAGFDQHFRDGSGRAQYPRPIEDLDPEPRLFPDLQIVEGR